MAWVCMAAGLDTPRAMGTGCKGCWAGVCRAGVAYRLIGCRAGSCRAGCSTGGSPEACSDGARRLGSAGLPCGVSPVPQLHC